MSDGIVHSLVVTKGVRLVYPFVGNPNFFKAHPVFRFFDASPGLVARFVNGRPHGKIWRGKS